jgi:isoaspartyl peptidase/L-asparaginase-like protein (Ntn-hydrolase superfamily)
LTTNLQDFTGGADGANPIGGVAVDASGNLYGTTSLGGMTGGNCYTQGCGVVWEITP